MWNRSSNPTLREGVFENQADYAYSGPVMTVKGTMGKIGLLFLIFLTTFAAGWLAPNGPAMIVTGVCAFIVAIATAFKPTWAPVSGPLYALLKGYFVGAISVIFASAYNGIVPQAALITLGVFLVMYTLYATGVIKVTQTFKMAVIGATMGIMVTYLITFIGGFFAPGLRELPIYQATPIGIGFSLLVLGIAALNLALDFQVIREGVDYRAPKYMEWYGAFALMVTIVWIYIEALNLLRKLQSR